MIDITVLIPQRGAADAVARQLPTLYRALEALRKSYELMVIDDASDEATQRELAVLQQRHDDLRVVTLDRPSGLSAALSAGLAAARGRELLVIEAGERYAANQIGRLLADLARADLVCGCRRRTGLAKFWHRLGRIPRWLLLGLDARDPDCLFWAARSEALAGIQLTRGMYRYISSFVAMRGFRVTEFLVAPQSGGRPLGDGWPNPGDLLCAWWLARRWRNYAVCELAGPLRLSTTPSTTLPPVRRKSA